MKLMKFEFGMLAVGAGLVLVVSGCSSIRVKEVAPPEKVVVEKIEAWDTCLKRPEAETRPWREAQEAKRQAAQRQADSAENPEGTAPVQQGTEEQAWGAVGGALEGAGAGVVAGLAAGADSPTGLVAGAVIGAIGAIILLNETPEDVERRCYDMNLITVRNPATGKTAQVHLDKKRDPEIYKRRLYLALVSGENGSEGLRVGDEMILYTARSLMQGHDVDHLLMTQADYERFMKEESERMQKSSD